MAKVGTTRYDSHKQEKSVAKATKGKLTLNSGACWLSKGDVVTENCIFECKTTQKDYYALNFTTWKKLKKESLEELKIPILCIDIQGSRIVVLERAILPKEARVILRAKKSIRLHPQSSYEVKNLTIADYELVVMGWDYYLDLLLDGVPK